VTGGYGGRYNNARNMRGNDYRLGKGGDSRFYIPQAKPLGDDYVEQAERLINEMYSRGKKITTSKIRSILSMVNELYNSEKVRTGTELSEESKAGLQLLQVRLFYECGRDNTVKDFVLNTYLIEYLKDIGSSREKFIKYARYVEALVAYHRYFGGDN